MKIKCNPLNNKSLNSAIKELEKYQKKIGKFEKQFCLALAEVGRERAQSLYDEAWAKTQDYPVTVTVEETENGAKIVANGESVCFLEFGSGDTASGAEVDGFTFVPGSWSSSELGFKQYSTWGFWVHNGEKYTAIEPVNAMTYAIGEMETRAREIAERVLGELK